MKLTQFLGPDLPDVHEGTDPSLSLHAESLDMCQVSNIREKTYLCWTQLRMRGTVKGGSSKFSHFQLPIGDTTMRDGLATPLAL